MADLHMKPPSTMGHESLIQRRPSLSHLGWDGCNIFSDIQSDTLNYHTPRHIYSVKSATTSFDENRTYCLGRC